MKCAKNGIALLLLSFLLMNASCSREEKVENPAVTKARKDAAAAAEAREIDAKAKDDLEKRMTVEVKGKADSILEARRQQKLADTVRKH